MLRVMMPLAALVMATAPAAAQMLPGTVGGQPLPAGEWAVRLGAGAAIGPAYPGGRAIVGTAMPMIDVAYRTALPGLDTVYLNIRDGLGAVVLRQGMVSVQGGIGFAPGRRERTSGQLRGMGNLDAGGQGNVTVRLDAGPLGGFLRAERAFGGQEGMTLTFGATGRMRISESIMLAATVSAQWADGAHMREWFGVSAAQSARSGLAAYRPVSGMRQFNAGLMGLYRLTPNWDLTAQLGVQHLLGDAARSPIVRRETAPFGLLGVSYRF